VSGLTTDPFTEKRIFQMSFFRNTTSAYITEGTSTLVHRTGADIAGVREAIDELTGLTVTVFPITMVREINPAQAMMTAAYVLAGPGRVYIGESTRIGRRLYDHSSDESKALRTRSLRHHQVRALSARQDGGALPAGLPHPCG
jgi:ABC-type uncharacterized transport system permease subunit